MHTSFVPRNIVTLFPDSVTSQLIQVSQQIHAVVPSHVILNPVDMLPHMTIYTTNFPEKNEAEVVARLRNITNTLKAFPIVFQEKVVEMNTIFLNAQMSDPLMSFHESIVDLLNDLREGFYDQADFELLADNIDRQDSIVKYGMWAAKSLFIPHITLSRPIDPARCNEALSLVPALEFSLVIDSVSYVVRGPHGTCQKVIQTFPFIT